MGAPKLLVAFAALALAGGLAWFLLRDEGSDVLVVGDPPGETVLVEGIAGTQLRARVPVSSTVGLYDIEISAAAEAETLPVGLFPDRFEALPSDVVGDVEVTLAPDLDVTGEIHGSFEVSGCTKDVSPCPESSTESAELELAWAVTAPTASDVPDVLAAPAPGRIEDDDGERRVTDELLVLLASTQSRARFDEEVRRLAELHDAVVVGADAALGLAQLASPEVDPQDLTATATALARDPSVDVVTNHWLGSGDAAQPDEPLPQDPDPSPGTDEGLAWNLEMIHASEAWATRADAEGVTVAVIDQQPDLVASVACASGDAGPRGVASGCELHPLAISALADRTTIDALTMIGAAKDLDADIVSVADVFGGDPAGCDDDLTNDQQLRLDDERELLTTLLEDSDPLWILATGAGCSDVASQVADLLDNVLPVTAVDERGDASAALATARAAVLAPGESPGIPGGSPGSIAAAHAAGLAALVAAENASFDAPVLRDCLTVGAAIGGRRSEGGGPSSPFVVNAPVSVGCNDIQDVMDAYKLPLVTVDGTSPENPWGVPDYRNGCLPPRDDSVVPENASCLSVLDVDLDGDDLRDRLLLYQAPSGRANDERLAVAVRGTGDMDSLSLGFMDALGVLPPPVVFEVADMNDDGTDEIVVPRALAAAGMSLDLIVDGENGLAVASVPLYVNGALAHGAGYRCRDTTGDGVPELILTDWRANLDTREWEWFERHYEWQGGTPTLIDRRSGFGRGGLSSPAIRKYVGGGCQTYQEPTRVSQQSPFPGGESLLAVDPPELMNAFLEAWWRGDREVARRLATPEALKTLRSPSGWADYVFEERNCDDGARRLAGCTFALISAQGGGFSYRALIGERMNDGLWIYEFEPLGGGA